ncbi:GNAT family N-acetyltransferase [Ferruginibacter sp. SUN002]|uniref:GNAT family N-acetyltransferase n=1 Tax=Ferruginibacter sp. SUN002 TaxID=2937789 RepID=UPI003D35A2C0
MLNTPLPSISQIETERLILRPLIHEDDSAILFIRSNDIVNRYIDRPKSITIEDARNFIIRIEKMTERNEGLYRAIILKETGELIGTTCYFNIDHVKGIAEIGYELHPDHHGKGLMQEAIREMLSVGFKQFNFKTIVAMVFPENERSIKVLERNNFLPDTTHQYVTEKTNEQLQAYYLLTDSFK